MKLKQTLKVLSLVAGISFTTSSVQAATFTVNSLLDSHDNNLADGICKTANNDCSLRAAIDQANNNPDGDIIQLEAKGYKLAGGPSEDANDHGDLDITQDVIIQGAGSRLTSIEGSGQDRVIHVLNAKVTLKDLAVRKGISASNNDDGAGILNNLGDLKIERCMITDNELNTASDGAGIHSDGNLIIESSTISNNGSIAGSGGAVSSIGTLSVNSSTISNNKSGNGGAISDGGISTITNSTLVFNTTANTGGVEGSGNQDTKIKNTIIAKNQSEDPNDCFDIGLSISQGFNLIGIVDCVFPTTTGDIFGDEQNPLDPQLGPLQDNGGPTDTHALLDGSPAIGKGDIAGCPDTDQRGFKRPDGTCDIGAFQTGCGDGIKQGTEECDDGNLVDGDDCSATCQIEGNGPGNGSGTGDGGGCELNAAQESPSQCSSLTIIGFLTLAMAGFGVFRFSHKK